MPLLGEQLLNQLKVLMDPLSGQLFFQVGSNDVELKGIVSPTKA